MIILTEFQKVKRHLRVFNENAHYSLLQTHTQIIPNYKVKELEGTLFDPDLNIVL